MFVGCVEMTLSRWGAHILFCFPEGQGQKAAHFPLQSAVRPMALRNQMPVPIDLVYFIHLPIRNSGLKANLARPEVTGKARHGDRSRAKTRGAAAGGGGDFLSIL